jgi:hypothetical protein
MGLVVLNRTSPTFLLEGKANLQSLFNATPYGRVVLRPRASFGTATNAKQIVALRDGD